MTQGRRIRTTKERITEKGAEESRCQQIPKGTVLLSFKLSIGKVSITDIDLFTNEAIAALPIIQHNKLCADFLYWALRSIRLDDEVDVAAKGRTLNRAKLLRIQIPLPPLEEQKRIAAILDKADALCRLRQGTIDLTEQLIQSVFIDMFGDPASNPKGWQTARLGTLGVVQTGNTPPRSNKGNYALKGMEWIKTNNLVEGQIIATEASEKLSEIGESLARIAPENSLLVACIAGSEKSIGRAALVDRRVAFNQQINAITPHKNISPLFLYYLLKTGRRLIQDAAAKGMKKIVNKKTFESIRFILPDYESEQLAFERKAKALLIQAERLNEQQPLIKDLFNSLQQRAFNGELDTGNVIIEEDLAELEDATEKLSEFVNVSLPKAFAVDPASKTFTPPKRIDTKLKQLDTKIKEGETIEWNLDYFKFRILGTRKSAFNFNDLIEQAQQTFEEISVSAYEQIRALIFVSLKPKRGRPALKQIFDEETKEIRLQHA